MSDSVMSKYQSTSKNKIDTVQDLRGIAVLYVVLFHVGNIFGLKIFIHGGAGVSLFFLISGFIISYIHRNDKGIKSAIIFAKKRIVRIYPPYLILLFVMLILFLVSGKGGDQARDAINIIRNLFLVQVPGQSIHPYAWSLVYEVYYYFTFFFLVIIFRLGITIYCLLMVAPYIIAVLLGDFAMDSDIVPLSINNVFFASGVIVGACFDKINIQFSWPIVISVIIGYFTLPFLGQNSGLLLLLVTVAFFVIYSKCCFSIRFLNLLGNSSYSIYLVHAVTLGILKNMIDDRNLFTFLLFVIVSVGLGHAYYIYAERPLLKKYALLLGLKK